MIPSASASLSRPFCNSASARRSISYQLAQQVEAERIGFDQNLGGHFIGKVLARSADLDLRQDAPVHDDAGRSRNLLRRLLKFQGSVAIAASRSSGSRDEAVNYCGEPPGRGPELALPGGSNSFNRENSCVEGARSNANTVRLTLRFSKGTQIERLRERRGEET